MAQMARYDKGPFTNMMDYTPAADVAAGDVVVDGDMLLICLGGAKTNGAGNGISANKLGAMVARGGIFIVAAAGAIGKRKRVYWDAAASRVTLVKGANLQFGFTCDVAAVNTGDLIPVEFSPGRVGDQLSQTVAATGSTQADAAALADGFNVVTAADGTKGVALPQASNGREVQVKNSSASALKVYPVNGGTDSINALSANTAMSIAANTNPRFTAYNGIWYSNPLLPS